MTVAPSVSLSQWKPAAPPSEHDADAIVRWAAERFRERSIVMTTSFGMEGVVLLDLISRWLPGVRVLYVDTGFLFPETLRLRDRLEARFPGARFEAVRPLLSPEEQAEFHGDALWRRDPHLCCRIRKVEPLSRAIAGADVWLAALRRSQSPTRQHIKIVDWDWTYQLVKVCPLAAWSREQVYEHIRAEALPYNELHDRSYPTVGCTHCTRPVEGSRPWEYSRDGRWSGTAKTECGLHGAGI